MVFGENGEGVCVWIFVTTKQISCFVGQAPSTLLSVQNVGVDRMLGTVPSVLQCPLPSSLLSSSSVDCLIYLHLQVTTASARSDIMEPFIALTN